MYLPFVGRFGPSPPTFAIRAARWWRTVFLVVGEPPSGITVVMAKLWFPKSRNSLIHIHKRSHRVLVDWQFDLC